MVICYFRLCSNLFIRYHIIVMWLHPLWCWQHLNQPTPTTTTTSRTDDERTNEKPWVKKEKREYIEANERACTLTSN